MPFSEVEKGDLVAREIWRFIQETRESEKVPWCATITDDPQAIGYQRALREVRERMISAVKQYETEKV